MKHGPRPARSVLLRPPAVLDRLVLVAVFGLVLRSSASVFRCTWESSEGDLNEGDDWRRWVKNESEDAQTHRSSLLLEYICIFLYTFFSEPILLLWVVCIPMLEARE